MGDSLSLIITRNSNPALWINLFHKKKIAGRILFNLKWKDPVGDEADENDKKKSLINHQI